MPPNTTDDLSLKNPRDRLALAILIAFFILGTAAAIWMSKGNL